MTCLTDTFKKVELIGLIMPHFNLIINSLINSTPLKSYLIINSNHIKLDQALSHLSTLFHHAAVLLLEITVLLKLQVTIHNTPGVIMDQVKLHFKTRNSAYFSTFSLQVPTTFSRLSQKSIANNSAHLSSNALTALFTNQNKNFSCKEKYLITKNHRKT